MVFNVWCVCMCVRLFGNVWGCLSGYCDADDVHMGTWLRLYVRVLCFALFAQSSTKHTDRRTYDHPHPLHMCISSYMHTRFYLHSTSLALLLSFTVYALPIRGIVHAFFVVVCGCFGGGFGIHLVEFVLERLTFFWRVLSRVVFGNIRTNLKQIH